MDALTSPRSPVIKHVRSLALRKHREAAGEFVAEGDWVLARARAEGWEPRLLLSAGASEPWGRARRLRVAPAVLASLGRQRNPSDAIGIFAQRWVPPPTAPRDLWLMVEALRDPGNLGTILRTADAVGCAGVILAGDCCDVWGPECVRATMGSIFAMPVARMAAGEAERHARAWPGPVIGTAADAPDDYRRAYDAPVLLLIGGEGHGLSPALAAACSLRVRIPMRGGVDSLNAAIAAALMLYELRRGIG